MIRLRVKEVAQEKGISQGKLARRADVDIKTLRRIYHEPFSIISTDTLDKLARALDVSARDLIEDVADEE